MTKRPQKLSTDTPASPASGRAAKRANAPDPLKAYRSKRDFARTSEPVAKLGSAEGGQFVVQKHDARRLHYDLRLELDGVLVSFAVTRGPSLNPEDKRLAVRTEDHPMKYLDFEGLIPKGEYGGGTMIVWDRGTWTPNFDPHFGLNKGHLEFELHGKRLGGRWHLVRMKPRPGETKEQWLLLKAEDEFAKGAAGPDMLEEETRSILSGLTNDEVAKGELARPDHKARAGIARRRNQALPEASRLKGAHKGLLPVFVEPSLAAPAAHPPVSADFVHEIKLDGYRMLARIDGREVKLLTRTGLDWTHRFKSIASALKGLRIPSAMLDGEIVVEDAAGIASFNELVTDLKSGRQERFRYFVFDLIYFDGSDVRKASLVDRKALLKEVLAELPAGGAIAYGDHLEGHGPTVFEHASRLGLEGIVSKRRDAPYFSGRGNLWIKSKCVERQEFVVVGYVPSTAGKRAVGSLILGYYEGGALFHAGRVGSGFSTDEAKALFAALEPTTINKPEFGRKPIAGAEKGVRWVAPKLVVEVEYRGWSKDGVLRHSTYRGIREDREPKEITREAPAASRKSGKSHDWRLTHPDRLLWPEQGITKQGLADFYAEIADWILPHLVSRPLSLLRCPGGIAAQCFFAKHSWSGSGDAIRLVENGGGEPFLAIEDLDGLIELVQANVLEIHPWGATTADLERPDRLIFDLDPADDVPWEAVVGSAREVRERLTGLGLQSYVKTTGGKGLHVVVPIIPALEWEPAKAFSKRLVDAMAADSPGRYVTNMAKSQRKGRIFLDYLRNGRGATAVAAFSTRARPGAAISTPLSWDELSAVKADHYRLDNIVRRLDALKRDPWEGFFSLRQRLPAAGKAKT
ncbi:ATP-dependent DNA ligase LigD phosphoesterase module /ATP-dependent DNA ligase LigD polymerase module [Rhizobiales bacterium GAS191]|nr:ATP-dependent DNA ligase LigD phosphoesterase module /ATP-dependent DNA ligase LigD polymerase module [Rhizobiales bacterium GAS191]